jgi:hypothetical protein
MNNRLYLSYRFLSLGISEAQNPLLRMPVATIVCRIQYHQESSTDFWWESMGSKVF